METNGGAKGKGNEKKSLYALKIVVIKVTIYYEVTLIFRKHAHLWTNFQLRAPRGFQKTTEVLQQLIA